MPSTRLKLAWFDAEKKRHEFELRGERLTIGRVEADVELDDDQISRKHAAIERDGDGFALVDLESRNGTFVEGSQDRVKRRRLADGETILVGKARLRVAILAGQAAAVKAEGATVIAQLPSDLPIVLTVVSGPDRGQVFSPPKEKITLGRLPTNDVPLNDPSLSRLHATIKREKGGYAIYDENSRNGIYVGTPPQRIYHGVLAHGDIVRLGGGTQIRVEMGGGAKVEASEQTFAIKVGESTFALSMPSLTAIRPREAEAEAAPADAPLPATDAVPAADAPPVLRFRILASGSVLEVPAGTQEVTIGRSSAAMLRIDDPSVSGNHCTVLRTPDGWVLKDIGSRNGTFVGDSTERVQSLPLRGGEELRLGDARVAVELGGAGVASAVEEGTQLTRIGAVAAAPPPPAAPPSAAPPAAGGEAPAAKGKGKKAEPIPELAKSAEAKQRISRIMKGVSLRPVRVPGTPRQWASLGMMLLAAIVSLGFSMQYPALLSAGPLHAEHAELESREKCGSCHAGFEGIGTRQTQLAMSGSCVTADCHASALANEPGIQDNCLDCHTDHRGRNFPIAGGKDVCWSCHLGRDEPRDFDARPMRAAATVAGGTAAIAKLAEPFRKVEIGLRFAHAAHDAETKGEARFDNCTGCHANVDDGRTFAMPGHAQCIECHEKAVSADEKVAQQKKGPDCLECHTREDGEMQELPPSAFAWTRFAHRDHGEELCQSCHAPVWEEGTYASVFRSPDVYVMTMDACVTCHEEKKATVACLDCHRSHHSFDGGETAAAAAPPARGFDRFLIGLATLILGGFAYLYTDMRVARRYLEPEQAAAGPGQAPAGAPPEGDTPKGEVMPFPTVDVEACISCSSCYNSCPKQVLAGDDHGKSTVVNPDSCIALEGCAVCEQGCPTGAIRVSTAPLVRTVERPDTDDHLEAKPMPGLFFVGEVIGAALIKSAVNQGTDVVRYIKDKKKRVAAPHYDVIVVGAGPAGLGAGLEAKATGLRYLVLERDTVASTIRAYPRDKAVLAEPVKVPLYGKLPMMDAEKDELIAVWEAVVKATGLEVQQHEEVSEIRREGELLKVKTAKGEYTAANVVLAIGTRGNPRRLGCTGEEAGLVSYNLIDAGDWKGKKVLVVGGGDSAIEAAVALGKAEGTTVWLSYRKNAFARVKKRNLEQIEELSKAGRIEIVWESSVTELRAEGAVLKLAAGPRTLDCVHVFALIGADPPRGWIEKIGVPFVEKQEQVIAWS